MDLETAAQRLGRGGYGGVLYAHTYGETSTPFDFFSAVRAADPSRLVIDDRCLCDPDLEPRPENPADVVLYSTGYAKVVDLGSGGYAFLQDGVAYESHSLPFRREDLEELEAAYKQDIASRQPFHYRDSAWLEAEAGRLPWETYRPRLAAGLDQARAHRQALNALYATCLPAEFQLPAQYHGWRFQLRLARRDLALKAIFAQGLFASAHYASLAGVFLPGKCPHAEALAGEVLNLFNDHHFSLEMAQRTCDIIQRVAL
jgi:hypothetical protein